MITDFPSLVQALQTDGASIHADAAAGTIQIPLGEDWIQSVLWLRWDPEHTLLHIMLPLPEPIPCERLSSIESLIAHVNHRLVVPGFGLDHEHSRAYFRLTVPRGEGGLLVFSEVRKLLRTTVETTRDFAPVFRAVAQDGKSIPEALALFRARTAPAA
jgi:hypothetical protein